MSTHSIPSGSQVGKREPAPSTYAQTPGVLHFWLRRVHSLAGIVFGGYVAVHLTVNATGFAPKIYQMNVDKIHDLEPMLPLIEIIAIFTPLLIHLIYGAYIAKAGNKFNTMAYSYGGNVRYTLQRYTAFILIAFVLYHIITLHKWGLGQFKPENEAYQSTVVALKTPFGDLVAANIAIMIFYLLGIWSATFHLANGLWTAAIAWGVTTTQKSQRRWGHVCCALGIGLTLVGTAAWVAFTIAGNPNLPISETFTKTHDEAVQTHDYKTGGGEKAKQPLVPDQTPGK